MKFRPHHRRTLVVVIVGLLLLVVQGQLNHYLAPLRLSVWLGGLFIAFSALRLAPQQGFNASFLLGLILDATQPVPFGLNAFLFSIVHLLILRVRNRFALQHISVGISTALITNLVLFVVLTFVIVGQTPGAALSGVRLLCDLALSQLFILIITPWFFALQDSALDLARVSLRDDPTGLI